MSDHLPECFYPIAAGKFILKPPCICDRLRACEERMLLSKPNIELSAVYGYEAGRSDGLNAARDAVAALLPADYEANWCAAIDAIDALRGEA